MGIFLTVNVWRVRESPPSLYMQISYRVAAYNSLLGWERMGMLDLSRGLPYHRKIIQDECEGAQGLEQPEH